MINLGTLCDPVFSTYLDSYNYHTVLQIKLSFFWTVFNFYGSDNLTMLIRNQTVAQQKRRVQSPPIFYAVWLDLMVSCWILNTATDRCSLCQYLPTLVTITAFQLYTHTRTHTHSSLFTSGILPLCFVVHIVLKSTKS